MNSGTSNLLNALHWVAAFVVLGHVCNIFVADYYVVEGPGLLLHGVPFLNGIGYIAVIVFFVISGFIICGRAILSSKVGGFNIINYFINRFSRVDTVLIPALIVGFILDRLGLELFIPSGIRNLKGVSEVPPTGTISLAGVPARTPDPNKFALLVSTFFRKTPEFV